MTGRQALLGLENIFRSFDRGRIRALSGVNLALRMGESVALVGRSGSGKSCLLNIASGLDRPDEGRVLWKGLEVTGRRRWAALRHSSIGSSALTRLASSRVKRANCDDGREAPPRSRCHHATRLSERCSEISIGISERLLIMSKAPERLPADISPELNTPCAS